MIERKIKKGNISRDKEIENNIISKMRKKEKRLSAGIYALIIIVTIVLMLILFNIVIKL
jgi:hypothetical protein